jgi:transglutaminase-like putative cysteine protease
MRVIVHHRTEYRYSQPLLHGVQYLRLTPRSGTSQTVNRWKIACPGGEMTEWADHYGNICHTLVIARPTQSVVIEVSGDVRTADTNGVIPSGTTTLPVEVYLRETAYTRPDSKLARFAQRFRADAGKDLIAGLHALMLAVREAVAYERNSTTVHTTAAEALAAGRGVCQDHAHLFIAMARQLGVPARYVSGYLGRGEGTQQTTASHAWAEALVPDLGWVSFDCANGISATEAYVRVAVGLDYADAGPVRGVRTGGGAEELSVKVQTSPRTIAVPAGAGALAGSESAAGGAKKGAKAQEQQ